MYLAFSVSDLTDPVFHSLARRYVRYYPDRVASIIDQIGGEQELRFIQSMIPPDLESKVALMLENGARLDPASILREIRRGNILLTPTSSITYERMIAEAETMKP